MGDTKFRVPRQLHTSLDQSDLMKKPACLTCLVIGVLVSSPAYAIDPHIRRVEEGLLPIAASQPGVPANIEDRMRAYGVPGLSIAVIDGGRIAWAKGYGVADSVSGHPVTPNTLFQAASISKPISAIGALLLVQQGRLQLDESANHALRSWKIPESTFTRDRSVTVRMLLNHTAGLEHVDSDSYPPFSEGDRLPSMPQILRGEPPARRGGVSVVSIPGGTFVYSAAGYEVLQQLVADVSGQPFEQFMQAEIFTPLGMRNSTFAQPLPESLRSVAATGHYAGGERLPGRFHVSPELSVAGLWTTPTDLAKYIISVQRASAGIAERLLGPTTTREMLRPGLGNRGLGPVISGSGQSIRFGHDGFNEGFESTFVAYEHQGQGAVVMTNSGFAFMLIKEVLNSVGRAYGWSDYGVTAQQPPSANIQQQRVSAIPAKTIATVAGEYVLGNTRITLYRSGSRLLLNWPTNGVAEVFATPDGRFFCPQLTFSDVGSPWLKFVLDKSHAVARILAGDDGSIQFERLNGS